MNSVLLKTQSKHYYIIEKAIQYISKNYDEFPRIENIAKHVGLSHFHFIRVFKEYAGVTPKQFLQCFMLKDAKMNIKYSKCILDATLNMGLSSTSRIHDLFVNIEGITPMQWKQMAKDVTIEYSVVETIFGKALLAQTKRGVCFFEFIINSRSNTILDLKERWSNAIFKYKDLQNKCDNMFKIDKNLNLFVQGSSFQINVWKALLKLPFGDLDTYSNIAKSIEKPKAVRAVASAIGNNTIGYFIPCHRVIAKSGAIAGYKWGTIRKSIIINYEKSTINSVK